MMIPPKLSTMMSISSVANNGIAKEGFYLLSKGDPKVKKNEESESKILVNLFHSNLNYFYCHGMEIDFEKSNSIIIGKKDFY